MTDDSLKSVLAQSLECPVCLGTYKEPKILLCSHTFCRTCLEDVLRSHASNQELTCPVCRKTTPLDEGDVNSLPTNLALKTLLEDLKTQSQCCTECQSEEKAKVFCKDCGKYLCSACQTKHSDLDRWDDHEVIDMAEMKGMPSGKRKYRKCKAHPREDEECFCADCRRFACFRCIIKEHAHEKHQVMEGSEFASSFRSNVEELRSKVDGRNTRIRKYIDYIDQQKQSISTVKRQCTEDITKAYNESCERLEGERDTLLQEIAKKNDDAEEALEKLKNAAQQQIDNISAMTGLVASGSKIPFETDALAAHDSLCESLQETLKQEEPDYDQASSSSRLGRSVVFRPNNNDEKGLGKLLDFMSKQAEYPINGIGNMVPTIDGNMAVGYRKGGVEIVSAHGVRKEIFLKETGIRYIETLSDGRFVVLDDNNTITLYTAKFEMIDVKFETLSNQEALFGQLAVDSKDMIYIKYACAPDIDVYSPSGGRPVQQIGFREEGQIIPSDDDLIVSNSSCLRVIDKRGRDKHDRLYKHALRCFGSVSHEKRIIVAWVDYKGTAVTIDEYSTDLKYVKTVVSEFQIVNPRRTASYHLREFRSGEIAFATLDKIYIFN